MNALEKSIVKWEGKLSCIVQNLGKPINDFRYLFGPDQCPLCKLYRRDSHRTKACVGCPVFKRTGVPFCEESPYVNVLSTACCELIINPPLISAIKEELNFLKSLLPKTEQSKQVEK